MSHPPALLLRGGRVLDPVTATAAPGDVLLAAGRVVAAGPRVPAPPGARVADAGGLLVAPGLVDAQVNGAAGADLTRDPQALPDVARALPRYGVTAFVPTVVSAPAGAVERLAAAARRPLPPPAAHVLGVHAEGPFLAPARRGAHAAEHLRAPDPAFVAGWSRATGVLVVTLAPELPGALDVVRALSARGVVVQLGHTDADYATVRAAVAAGARGVTHLHNAMPAAGHREPGPVGAALGDGDLVAGVLVDGHHLHPATVRATWKALGRNRFLLVSDATAALGGPPGPARLGDLDVVLDGGAVRLAADPAVLAGSATGLDGCVRALVAATGCPLEEALVSATLTPATLLGADDVGHLRPGARADVTLWDGTALAGVVVGGVVVGGVVAGGVVVGGVVAGDPLPGLPWQP